MSDYDELVLRDQIQRLAGHGADDDVAYAALLQRVRIAKRRRAVTAMTSVGAVCILGFGALALRSGTERQLSPVDDDVDDVALVESTTTPPTAAPTVAAPTTDAATTTEPATTSTTIEVTTTTDAATTTTVPESASPANPPATNATTPTSHTPGTGSAKPPAAAGHDTRTIPSKHGSITVSISDGVLTLVGKSPANGASVDVRRVEPGRIRVQFNGADGRSTIDVFVADGTIAFSTDEEGNEPDNTFDDGTGDDGTGDEGHGGGSGSDDGSSGPGSGSGDSSYDGGIADRHRDEPDSRDGSGSGEFGSDPRQGFPAE